jgi:hypothetical protein
MNEADVQQELKERIEYLFQILAFHRHMKNIFQQLQALSPPQLNPIIKKNVMGDYF